MTSSSVGRFANVRGDLDCWWRVGKSRRWLSSSVVALTMGCGVTEHPHESALIPVDTNDDFAPAAGVGPVVPSPTNPVVGPTPTPTSTEGESETTPTTSVVDTSDTAPATTTTNTSTTTNPTTTTAPTTTTSEAVNPTIDPAPTTSTGLTINLGGVDLLPEKVIAFIHVGHSNMAGRARSPSESRAYHFDETHPRAYMYHTGSAPELALEPNTAGDAEALRGNIGGPGTALVKQAAELAPDYYFVSLGFGQASAYCSQFLPGALYYDKLIAAPLAIKGRVTFGGIFIYLGITERHGTAEDRTGFAQCINTLATAIRTDVGVPDLPVLLNDYEVGGTGEFVVGGEVYTAIKPQIDECPTVVSNLALVSCEGVAMQDDHHFNLDGQRTWAQRALETMQTNGWFDWGM